MEKLTIFTPTYNRAYILENAYKSLENQTNKDFVWMIIDDGSTDNTYELIEKWQRENKIKIQYYKKENGGKHTAYNYALDKIQTELVMIALDSDDYLTKDSVEIFIKNWNKRGRQEIKGIVALCNDSQYSNSHARTYDAEKLAGLSLQDSYIKNLFDASAIFVFETEYLKNFKYPEIEGEKFFTEAYTYYQMTAPMIWLNDTVCIREFREDGLTKNTMKLFYNNPVSWYIYNVIRANCTPLSIRKIKYIIYSIAFRYKKNNIYLKKYKVNCTLLEKALFPIGVFGSFYMKRNLKRGVK